ncbi:hypothetical protein M3Y94_00344700 [Aphelenchoides besseyi]|nr:hypothetical protein M3Y94_00344700 [Aphelenchoides besseyi]
MKFGISILLLNCFVLLGQCFTTEDLYKRLVYGKSRFISHYFKSLDSPEYRLLSSRTPLLASNAFDRSRSYKTQSNWQSQVVRSSRPRTF